MNREETADGMMWAKIGARDNGTMEARGDEEKVEDEAFAEVSILGRRRRPAMGPFLALALSARTYVRVCVSRSRSLSLARSLAFSLSS